MADPTIALRVAPAEAPSGPAFNPFEMISKLAQTRATMLEVQNAQQTLAAKQRAGQLMANAPDLESGINAMQKDPSVAGFAPDILASLAGVNSSLVAAAGQRQAQSESGLGTLLKSISAGINDPSMVKTAAYGALQTMSPDARKAMLPAYTQIVHSLTDGLPADPELARPIYQRRLAALSLSAGLSPDTVRASTGTVAPSQTLAPVGEGGAMVPVQLGGPVTGPSASGVVGGDGTAGNSLALPPGPGQSDLTAPVASPAQIKGQTQQQQAASSAKGAQAGELSAEMAAASDIALPLKKINMMTDALSQFQSGGGAETRTQLGTSLQALKNAGLPVSQDTIDKVANGSLQYSQLFDSEIKPFLVKQLTDAAAGQGRVTKTEVDSFITSMDSTKDPATVMKLLNQAKYSLQIQYDKSQKYLDFKKALKNDDPSVSGLDENDFPEWYIHHFDPEKLPQATGGGLGLGPAPIDSAIGGQDNRKGDKRPSLDTFFK